MTKTKPQARHRRACRPVTPLTGLTENLQPVRSLAAVSVTGVALSVLSGGVAQADETSALDIAPKALPATATAAAPKAAVNPAVTASSSAKWSLAAAVEVEAEAPVEPEEVTVTAHDDSSEGADRSYERTALEANFAPPSTAGGAAGVAAQYIGVPYVWGGETPAGFDCSGLVKYVYAQLGYSLPHSSSGIAASGYVISAAEAQPGDIVYYPYGHVGIYVGNGQMIHATTPGRTVEQAPIFGSGYYFVRL